jgi:glycine/D-amino acid oxidase-like deaminating enzyme/nitrite reductase/ring-hydroxylating ferredoxin subunit
MSTTANRTSRTVSLWMDSTAQPSYPPLSADTACDVCVVGAGFTGLTAALAFARAGASVVVLEAGAVGGGVSGHTTGKLSALHGLIYEELTRRHGIGAARIYADAQQQAIAFTRRLVEDLGIDCDLRERTAYVFARDAEDADDVEAELIAATAAGLPVRRLDAAPLPLPSATTMALDGQLELHPRKYTLALAEELARLGVRIHQHSAATGLTERGGPQVHVGSLRVRAGDVIVASHMPVFDRGVWFTRLSAKRSYLVAIRDADVVPDGMFISAGTPTRSVRVQPYDGADLVLLGGEGHTAGEHGDETPERYARLEADATAHFGGHVTHRWSSQDLMPADGLPYAGRLTPISAHVHLIAGFRKWGLTTGPAAALALADKLAGRDSPLADLLDAWRLTPRLSARRVAAEGNKTSRHLVGDRLKPVADRTPADLQPGEGALLKHDGDVVAAHRDHEGTLRMVSATCTHLGCRVAFNAAEETWDCPCHASRFAPDGTVIQGPATTALAPVDNPPGRAG